MTSPATELTTPQTQPPARFNLLAIASLVLAVVAAGSLIGFGIAAVAVFSVSAGHIALFQIRTRGGRGAAIARAGLIISYAVATFALINAVQFAIALTQQMTPVS